MPWLKIFNTRRSATDDALAAVTDRLQRVEDSLAHQLAHQTPQSKITSVPASRPSPGQPIHNVFSPFVPDRARSAPWSPSRAISTSELDVTSALKDAVDQVQKIRLRGLAHDTVSEDVTIPPALAKRWLQSITSPFSLVSL